MTKFFKRFFMTYVFILVITLVAFLLLYSQSSSIIEDNILNSRLANLRTISADLDNSLVDIVQTVNVISGNTLIRNFINVTDPYGGPNIIRVTEAKRTLRTFYISNPLLINIFLVYDSNNVVVSNNVAWRTTAFYGSHLNISGMDYTQWMDMMFAANYRTRFIPATDMQLGSINIEAVQLITPIRSPQGNRGAIVSLIDNRAINDIFSGIDLDENGISYVLAPDGSVLSFTATAESQHISSFPVPAGREGTVKFDVNGISYLMSYTHSSLLGLTYVSVIRSDYVLAELNRFRSMVLFIILAMLAVTIPFSIIFATRQSKPIKQLQDAVAAQMPLLQHSFITDILEGRLLKADDAEDSAVSLGVDLGGSHYIAAAISGKDSPMEIVDLTKIRMFVDNYAQTDSNPHIKHYSANISRNELAIVFISESSGLEDYVGRFSALLAESLCTSGINGISIGIGGAYTRLTDVYKSFSEAIEAIQYHLILDNTRVVCSFTEIPHNNEFYFYPDGEEKRLLNMVRNGATEEVRTVLNDICGENFINRQLSHNMMTAFINHLCQGIFKIDKIGHISEESSEKINKFYKDIYRLSDLEKLTHCTQLYTMLSEGINEQKSNKTRNVITEIKALCEENYQDPDISLASLAARYNLSETYLSSQFKEHTGENFYTFVQNLRTDKAVELLATSKLSIHKISEQVGYSSYNTFSKAFKRKTGINARDYRTNIQASPMPASTHSQPAKSRNP